MSILVAFVIFEIQHHAHDANVKSVGLKVGNKARVTILRWYFAVVCTSMHSPSPPPPPPPFGMHSSFGDMQSSVAPRRRAAVPMGVVFRCDPEMNALRIILSQFGTSEQKATHVTCHDPKSVSQSRTRGLLLLLLFRGLGCSLYLYPFLESGTE